MLGQSKTNRNETLHFPCCASTSGYRILHVTFCCSIFVSNILKFMVSILWLVHILSFTCWIKLIIITVTEITLDLDQISLYGGSPIDCRSIGTISPVSSSVRSVGFQRRHLLKDTIAKTVQKPWWRNLQTQGVNKTQISVHADTYSPIQTYTRESLEWRWYEIAPWAWKLRDCHPNSSQKCLHMSMHDIPVISNCVNVLNAWQKSQGNFYRFALEAFGGLPRPRPGPRGRRWGKSPREPHLA